MTRKLRHRPNVMPATHIPLYERTEDVAENKGYTKDLKTRRRLIQDMCDFCYKYIYVERSAMSLRNKGWRMVCNDCFKEKDLNCKRDKVWHEYNWQVQKKLGKKL